MLAVKILVFYLIYMCLPANILSSSWSRRSRISYCKTPDSIDNAIMTRRSSILRITCQKGYTLQGPRLIECIHGKWVYDVKPVCAKKGCDSIGIPHVENGYVRFVEGFKVTITCFVGYIVAGNRESYCDGMIWDRPLGECRNQSNDTLLSCDFETDDICGWHAETIDSHEWKRKSSVNIVGYFNTGPQHDHTVKTKSDGHFMIMESLREYGVYVPLISPIYKRDLSLSTACCFRFYYFMYGVGIGDLYVFVKPYYVSWENLMHNYPSYMKFNISGHQESSWKEVIINIEEMATDFQIVFLAKSTKSHLSDIAIDDVSLMIGSDCPRHSLSANTTTTSTLHDTTDYSDDSTTIDPIVADAQSCASRCFDSTKSGIILQNGTLYLYCNCHLRCEETQSCCLDFRSECLDQIYSDMPEENSTTTTIASTISTTIKTTKPSTTTTTRKLLSTSTTTPTIPTFASTSKITKKTQTTTTLKVTMKPTYTTKSITPKTTLKTTLKTTTTATTTPRTTTTLRIITPRTTSSTSTSTTRKGKISSIAYQNTTFIKKTTEIMTTPFKNKTSPDTTTSKTTTTTSK